MPSRNMPPGGEELACQEYLARYLGGAGLSTELYEPDQAPGMVEHPAYWPGPTIITGRTCTRACLAWRRPLAAAVRPCRYGGAG